MITNEDAKEFNKTLEQLKKESLTKEACGNCGLYSNKR